MQRPFKAMVSVRDSVRHSFRSEKTKRCGGRTMSKSLKINLALKISRAMEAEKIKLSIFSHF